MTRRTRLFLLWPAGTVAALLVAVGAFVWLAPGPTARLAFAVVRASTGYDVACTGMTGNILSDFTCADLTVADSNGIFLRARAVRLAWRPWPLVAGGIDIAMLHVGAGQLTRVLGGNAEPATGPKLPHWPSGAIVLSDLVLHDFSVSLPGKPAICIDGGGRLRIARPIVDVNAKFTRCGGQGTLTAVARLENGRLDLDTRLQDDGTLAALLLGWPGTGPTDIRISGMGPLRSFRGALDATVANGGEANLRIEAGPAAQTDMTALNIGGAITLAPGRAPDWAPADNGAISVRAFLPDGGGLELDQGQVLWGNSQIHFTVKLDKDFQTLDGQIDADLAPFQGALAFASAHLDLTAGGTVSAPLLQGRYRIRQVKIGTVAAAEVNGQIGTMQGGDGALPFATNGTVQGLSVSDALDPVIGPKTTYDVTGTYKDGALAVHGAADASYATLEADFKGLGGAPTGTLSLTLKKNAPLGGVTLPGGMTVSANLTRLTGANQAGTVRIGGPLLAATGRFAHMRGMIDASVQTSRVDSKWLSEMTGVSFATGPALRLAVHGTLDNPAIDATATAPSVATGDFALVNAVLSARLMRGQAGWRGETGLAGGSSAGRLSLKAALIWNGHVDLRLHDSSWADATVAGHVTAAEFGGPYQGQIALEDHPLAPVATLAGIGADGQGTIALVLDAKGDQQTVGLNLDLQHVAAGGGLTDARVTGRASYDLAARSGDLALDVKDGTNTLHLAAGSASRAAGSEVTLHALDATWIKTPVRLLQPVTIMMGEGDIVVPPATVALGAGRAVLSGARRRDVLSAQARLTDVPVDLVSTASGYGRATGALDGNANLRLAPADTDAQFTLQARNVAFGNRADAGAMPAGLVITGNWNGTTLSAQGEVTGMAATPARLDLTLPLRRTPNGFGAGLVETGPVSGHLVATAQAERLLAVLPIAEHRLTGALAVDLSLSGTLGDPAIDGTAKLQNGTYESLQLGTRLDHLNLTATARGAGSLSVEADASDGESGTLKVVGNVSLAPDGSPIGRLQLNANDAYLVRRDQYSARATGQLTVERDRGAAPKITGKFTTSEIRFDLGTPLPKSVQQIDVVEIHRPPSLGEPAASAPSVPPFARMAMLDIDVNMPRRVYVQGRGVDSEWQGNLRVTGTLANPAIGGKLTVVRGMVEMLGRQFTLQKGTVTPDPDAQGGATLNVTASHTEQNLTVNITAEGPAAAPTITLSSDPALPRAEILSRLYFGRGTPQLSPYEALQLAQLSGQFGQLGGGAGGVLGFARQITHLDVLRVEGPGDEGGGPRVAVGKYISDSVYVGAKRGGDASTGTAEVQVQVTPHISVDVETGLESQAAAGVNWNWDY